MDIISYGVASQASSHERTIRDNVLGKEVTGGHPTIDSRLDAIERTIKGASLSADRLILQNTINIMKAHARLNALTQTKKYQMHQMVFDDLLDLSGIDPALSSGYTHDALEGSINGGTLVTTGIPLEAKPKQVVLITEEILPPNDINIALGKPVKGITGTFSGDVSIITDGSKVTSNNRGFVNSLNGGEVEVDLGDIHSLREVSIYIGTPTDTRSYQNVGIKLSPDGIGWKDYPIGTVFLQAKDEIVPVFGEKARYIRWYCGINTKNNYGHFTELEAYPQANHSSFYLSLNDGQDWEPVIPGELFTVPESIDGADPVIRLKADLTGGTKLLNYALTWA